MSSRPLPPRPVSPPSGVRRHHTISSSSRPVRTNSKEAISEETQDQQLWNDDEVVDQDWVGGMGAVGEKGSLHRQSSLPTRYHRGPHGKGSRSGSATPKTLNSLSTISGHEGEEEDWERDSRDFREDDVHIAVQADHLQPNQVMDNLPSGHSPLPPPFDAPSPPPAGTDLRRHQSFSAAPVGGPRQMSSAKIRRAGTVKEGHNKQPNAPQTQSPPTPPEDDYNPEDLYDEYGDAYTPLPQVTQQPQPQPQGQGQYPASSIGRSSPWNSNADTGGWRNNIGSNSNNNTTIDDALSALEIASVHNQMYSPPPSMNHQHTQPNHPPRFNSNQTSANQLALLRSSNNSSRNSHSNVGSNSRSGSFISDLDGRKTPVASVVPGGASGYGSSVGPLASHQHHSQHQRSYTERDDRLIATLESGSREQRDRLIGGRSSNPNLQYSFQQHNKTASVPSVPAIPTQYLSHDNNNQQLQQGQQNTAIRLGSTAFVQSQAQSTLNEQSQGVLTFPIDVPTLIATKGYNPANFDIRPQFARYFVIKSFTEDDVHKSLKYEIWSSTDPGNKRLDKAFKETAGRGPIYLFFSVNASGHFCGMAEMMTPVDYTRSSNVWASDKWKGVFKVRWIFVRDIPNVNLRHIKLNNTQERKPVTNSRDTQELLPDAGQEMLRIFHSHPARTSLLQDFAFYELQSMKRMQAQTSQSSPTQSPNLSAQSPQPQSLSPGAQPQPFNMLSVGNPNALAYQMPQMTPLMQLQMQMNMGLGSQFTLPQAQAMHQSVMRHSSPSPPGTLPVSGQSFMGMPSF